MSDKQKAVAAWILFGLIFASVMAQVIYGLATQAGEESLLAIVSDISWLLGQLIFGLVGALIISRQPRNVIGLLLMLPALVSALSPEGYFAGRFPTAPDNPNLFIYLILWYSGWHWLLLIMPIFFILVLFPTGKPYTLRWRWPIYLGLAMSLVFILFGAFYEEFATPDWSVANPIGYISADSWETYVATPWYMLMIVLTVLSFSALFVRYRLAGIVEREQIKWLFFAALLLTAVYAGGFLHDSLFESDLSDYAWYTTLLAFAVSTIPIAIGIAVLRYHLFDIDIIIRRTLVYGLLTAILLAVYFGIVLLAQAAFVALTGEQNPVAVVLSTLLIAMLFNPLRKRIQAFIDRRFYRQKYDAVQTLQTFAKTARRETNLGVLSGELTGAVQRTMQPAAISLWLRGAPPIVGESAGEKSASDR